MKMPEERQDISMKALLLQTKMDILPVSICRHGQR